MKKKILVYDSQGGYYKLIKQLSQDFEFVLYTHYKELEFADAVAFFMNDKIEALDVVKLYTGTKPFIMAADNDHTDIKQVGDAYFINIAQPREQIIKLLTDVLKRLR